MWLSLILLLLILAVTYVQSTQGLFSAMVMMVLTICCAAAAIGSYEWIAINWIAPLWKPNMGFPLALGVAFGVPLVVLRIALDRAVLAEVVTTLGSIPIAEYGTPSTRELADTVAPYVKSHDGLLLANHGALALGRDLFGAYYKMETIEHFAKISLTARLLGREHLLSREEVMRLQDLRSTYGIAAPAPFCPDPEPSTDDPSCQIIQAPSSSRERLVPDTGVAAPGTGVSIGADGEIRLTYAELTALIDEAVKTIAGR